MITKRLEYADFACFFHSKKDVNATHKRRISQIKRLKSHQKSHFLAQLTPDSRIQENELHGIFFTNRKLKHRYCLKNQ
jgi:hypothetical protein